MNANKSEVKSVNTGQLSEKLIRKQANLKDKINETPALLRLDVALRWLWSIRE